MRSPGCVPRAVELLSVAGACITGEVGYDAFHGVFIDYGFVLDIGIQQGSSAPVADSSGYSLVVDVYVDDGEITNVLVTEHSETESVAEPAIEQLTDAIIEAQSTEIDVVSGAIETSEELLRAVQRAVEEAEEQ